MSQAKAIDVVKRSPKRAAEAYDPGKLYASIYASCVSVRRPEGVSDSAARQVCQQLNRWCANKDVITSADIRETASKILVVLDPDAAYIYKNYRKII